MAAPPVEIGVEKGKPDGEGKHDHPPGIKRSAAGAEGKQATCPSDEATAMWFFRRLDEP